MVVDLTKMAGFDSINSEIKGFPSLGWKCPECGRVYSPTTPMCFYCGGNKTSTSTTYNSSNTTITKADNEYEKNTTE